MSNSIPYCQSQMRKYRQFKMPKPFQFKQIDKYPS